MRSPLSPCRAFAGYTGVHPDPRSGLALITTIMVLALIGALTAVAFTGAIATFRTAVNDYESARTFYAAEAGAEAALAQLQASLEDGVLEDSELAAIKPPPLAGFSYDGFRVERVGGTRVDDITDGPFAGLYALNQNVDVHSIAASPSGVTSGVVVRARAQAIPLFQFGVFYDDDLEVTNGPPMHFYGRVHSNGDIYISSAHSFYHEMITTPRGIFNRRKNENVSLAGVEIDDKSGDGKQLRDHDSEAFPNGEEFKAMSCEWFGCRVQTAAFGVQPLRLPLPPELPAYELIRARDSAGDGKAERQVKYAWRADTYVIVDLTDVDRWTDQCGGGVPPATEPEWVPALTIVRDDGADFSAAEACDVFRWKWSAFYDGREQELKDVLSIDVEALAGWVGPAERSVSLIYVEFVLPPTIGAYSRDILKMLPDAEIDPAVRLVRGSELPAPLSVATEWPVYVEGDYNRETKKPASLAGDGITILSEAWEDEENRPEERKTGPDLYDRCHNQVADGIACEEYEEWAEDWENDDASETTVNAAILAGHWATPCDNRDPGCPEGYHNWYGGGLENFPRFLEDWGGVYFHYRGALVSLFTSQKTDGTWNGDYYSPPNRDWAFDKDFESAENLPPGTPTVGSVFRSAFRESF